MKGKAKAAPKSKASKKPSKPEKVPEKKRDTKKADSISTGVKGVTEYGEAKRKFTAESTD